MKQTKQAAAMNASAQSHMATTLEFGLTRRLVAQAALL
jgi:hypothetical protein